MSPVRRIPTNASQSRRRQDELPILSATLLKCALTQEKIIMTSHALCTAKFLVCVALLLVSTDALGAQQSQPSQSNGPATIDMTVVKPESVGFSSERLERLHSLMQQTVDQKQLPGAVTILARHGKVLDYRVYGVKDVASSAPLTKDAIFRAFSMTKPITAVAMLQLYEQGKWLPSDPISKFVPEFEHLKVFRGVDAAGNMILEDPVHAPTMAELMTHTAGFTYGFFGSTLVDKEYQKANLFQAKSSQEFIEKLAKLPLTYQPGTRWSYSVSMDVQGYIIEKLSGQPLPDYMQEHIFKPLGMKDTAFYVPAEKRSRFVTMYRGNEKGEMVPADTSTGGDYAAQPGMASGGGGSVSTAEDYYRFASMLANGGELNGVRILAPSSVQLMSTNHLAPHLLTGEFGIGVHNMRPGFGYGYNCAVEYDPQLANLPDGRGTFFWDGAAGTWFWIDPTNDVVFVAMIQRLWGPGMPMVEYQSRSAVYQALLNPKK
jgi:CubicO group peptidase (beta-lactamase class C family)